MVEVFFDGDCAFCMRVINSFKEKDTDNIFSFIPLQKAGKKLPKKYHDLNTIVVKNGKKILVKSDAVLYIYEQLGGYHRCIARLGKFFPRFIRNYCYSLIGSIRHAL